MGLLLGASVITIFEFMDLVIYNAFVKCCRRRYKRKEEKRNKEVARLTRLDHTYLGSNGNGTDCEMNEHVEPKSGVYTSKAWFQ